MAAAWVRSEDRLLTDSERAPFLAVPASPRDRSANLSKARKQRCELFPRVPSPNSKFPSVLWGDAEC
jgi:hypothetical protein